MDLNTPIEKIGGIYKKYASRLEKLGITSLEDFLYHVPFRYEDYSLISKIGRVQPGETVTVQGEITEIKNEYTRRFRNLQKAKVEDETGSIKIIWFNQPFISKIFKTGDRISLSGKVKLSLNGKVMESPEYEILNGETIHTGRLVPVYSETRGVSSKWLRRQVYQILKDFEKEFIEYIPAEIISKNNFFNFKTAIGQIHFPDSLDYAEKARKRLSFDELLIMQLKGYIKRRDWEKKTASNIFEIEEHRDKIENFLESLPFELTNAQKRAVEEIIKDLKSEKPMNRLLEGDVGSGKTVVGAIGMYLSFLNGFQSVLMAPTEILANQHFNTISKLLIPFGVKINLKTGSTKNESRITNNEKPIFDILIGTHAVLSGKIYFEKLGLVVIDEQQRFGVKQRAVIRSRGKNPHLLTMTATPIPRTVALTMYGNLDVSFLDEMPLGRKIIKTWLVPEEKRNNAYKWIEKEIIKNKTQAFIICPFIEESETMTTVKAATKEFEILKKQIFPDMKLSLLHGKLKSKEKEKILDDFSSKGRSASGGKNRKTDILVATPVVEVGIDIPNATIMVIEASERFGLSQLHQLRGRVGRNDMQSYCLLFTESRNPKTIERLKGMEKIYIGAELAELDLRLRGPGEIFGTTQHGVRELKIASFSDFSLIEKVRKEAEKIFPKLKDYPKLLEKINTENLSDISPD